MFKQIDERMKNVFWSTVVLLAIVVIATTVMTSVSIDTVSDRVDTLESQSAVLSGQLSAHRDEIESQAVRIENGVTSEDELFLQFQDFRTANENQDIQLEVLFAIVNRLNVEPTFDGEDPAFITPDSIETDSSCAEDVFSGDWWVILPHESNDYYQMEISINCNVSYGTFVQDANHFFTLTGLVVNTNGRFMTGNLNNSNQDTQNPLDFDVELWIEAGTHTLFRGRYLTPGGWRGFCGARDYEFVPRFDCNGQP